MYRQRARRDEFGAISALLAIMLPVFLGAAALVVDLGLTWQTRRHLQNCADAAALAGAADLADTSQAAMTALSYSYSAGPSGCLNAGDPAPAIAFLDRDSDGYMDAMQVIAQRDLRFGFASVLGTQLSTPGARAVAGKIMPTGLLRTAPFGLQVDSGQPCGMANLSQYRMNGEALQFGQVYLIKYSADTQGAGSPGNFQALALGGTGANNYRDNVQYGYPGWQYSCGSALTETGSLVGPTIQGLQRRLKDDYPYTEPWQQIVMTDPPVGCARWSDCPRVIIIAIVPPLPQGQTTTPILTFGWFLIESYKQTGNQAAQMTGRFIDARDRRAPPGSWRGSTPWTPTGSQPFGLKLLE